MIVTPEARELTKKLLLAIGDKITGPDAAMALTIALGAILSQAPVDRIDKEALARKCFDVLIDLINREEKQ